MAAVKDKRQLLHIGYFSKMGQLHKKGKKSAVKRTGHKHVSGYLWAQPICFMSDGSFFFQAHPNLDKESLYLLLNPPVQLGELLMVF